MEYLAVASASVAGPLPRQSSPSADKHMFNVLGRGAREGPYTQDQARRLMAGSARVNVATLNQVFLVLMMLVHWSYLKVNSRREGACSQRRCGESPRAKFESVIGRPQNNSSWTDSEAVY